MILNLTKSYKIATLSGLNEDLLSKRAKAITTIIKPKKIDIIQECIRLYLGKPNENSEFIEEFYGFFHKEDGMFLREDSELELRILSGVVISEFIKKDIFESIQVALILKIASFGIDSSTIINNDVINEAHQYLLDNSISERESDVHDPVDLKTLALKEGDTSPESVSANFSLLQGFFKSLQKSHENEVSNLKHKIQVLQEESDIHWWIFRGFNSILEKPVGELDNTSETVLAVTKEFADLITISPPPNNSKDFLKIVFHKTGLEDKKISILEFESAFKNLSEKLNLHLKNTYGNLVPLYSAFITAKEIGTEAAWISIFEAKTKTNVQEKFEYIDIAEQFIAEYTLVNFY